MTVFQEAPLAVLYRDEYLIAIHKPSGLLVHRTVLDWRETRFALQILRNQIGQRVYPVHRLDRGTSGVLLFALDSDTSRALAKQFEAGTVEKRYWAIVRGHPPENGEIDHALTRQKDDVDFLGQTVIQTAQDALTRYQRLACAEIPVQVDRYPTSRYALLELEPVTGRRHQLRRHLKHISHPIIGDATYGKGRHNRLFAERFDCARLLLTCRTLTITHPVSGTPLQFCAPMDADFARVMAGLGWQELIAVNDELPPAHE
ncbi:tRNA pseudouridine65 synthase [Formivibrio citricus]|uniref:tRNA pseudouridine synthase C n=1 Tax=Formivibrio citricus TaxID=83765 RepID=A0A1I5DMA9_9NEIS|nr:tRNA pseudouridine(65) synthase TruC [Formivibrio citricus]SFO00267.1 tRNA pseudouridine65 synthase [Formivibrio citricus]